MMDTILTPWQHGFMQHAFIAIIMVGIICGITGVFVTLRGMAFLGDALSHAIFPGVVIAFITGGNFLVGALIAALIVSLGIGAVTQNGRINNDTAIGVFFVGAFALGIALLSLQKSYVRDLNAFLLGSILGVSPSDLRLIAIVGALVLGIIFWFRRELTMVSFDRTFAKASGLNLWFYDQLFLIVLAFTIVISLQTVGNILVLAMLVTPAATARLLTDRMLPMLGLSAFIGAASGITGLYLSYYQGIPSGSGVVLVATGVFFIAYLFAPRTGIVTSRIVHRRHRAHPEHDADFLASAD
jgi:manganese/iron transport system permease protein